MYMYIQLISFLLRVAVKSLCISTYSNEIALGVTNLSQCTEIEYTDGLSLLDAVVDLGVGVRADDLHPARASTTRQQYVVGLLKVSHHQPAMYLYENNRFHHPVAGETREYHPSVQDLQSRDGTQNVFLSPSHNRAIDYFSPTCKMHKNN